MANLPFPASFTALPNLPSFHRCPASDVLPEVSLPRRVPTIVNSPASRQLRLYPPLLPNLALASPSFSLLLLPTRPAPSPQVAVLPVRVGSASWSGVCAAPVRGPATLGRSWAALTRRTLETARPASCGFSLGGSAARGACSAWRGRKGDISVEMDRPEFLEGIAVERDPLQNQQPPDRPRSSAGDGSKMKCLKLRRRFTLAHTRTAGPDPHGDADTRALALPGEVGASC